MKKLHKGFTLIELMIVVAIIGILAALAIPNFIRFQARSKQSEVKANLKSLFTAERSYFQEKDTYSCNIRVIGFNPERGNRDLVEIVFDFMFADPMLGLLGGQDRFFREELMVKMLVRLQDRFVSEQNTQKLQARQMLTHHDDRQCKWHRQDEADKPP